MHFCTSCMRSNGHASYCTQTPLAAWERELLDGDTGHRDGEGDVTFTRLDGRKVTIKNVRVESIGPAAENFGVIGVEYFDNDDVTHVPFVESWVIEYRF